MKFDKAMMETAKIWSQESYCKRNKVGAVLSKDGRILATGFNGTISGQKNVCENETYSCQNCGKDITDIVNSNQKYFVKCQECHTIVKDSIHLADSSEKQVKIFANKKTVTNDFVLHAEQNVITFCAKNGIPTNGTTLYVTLSPCKQCSKLIAQAGISKVVFKDYYRDRDGIDFLQEVGIEVRKFK